MNSSCL